MDRFRIDLFDFFLFLYFLSLHADQLGFSLAGYHIRANNIISFLLFVCIALRWRTRLFSIDRTLFSSLLLISISVCLSAFLSPYKGRCAFFVGWYFFTVLAYFLFPYVLLKSDDKYKFFSLYILSFVAVGVYALLQMILSCFGLKDPYAGQILWDTIVRPNAFSYEPSFYALYMTPFVMMCNFHFLFNQSRPFFCLGKLNFKKIVFLNTLFVISTSASIVFAYGLFFICAFVYARSQKKCEKSGLMKRVWKFVGSFCSICVALLILAPFLVKNVFMKFFFFGFFSHLSFFYRWAGVKNAWNVFCEHLFFGVGLGGYPSYLFEAFLKGNGGYIFFEKDIYNQLAQGNALKLFEPTNAFTEMLASLGIIGLLSVFYLIYTCYAKAKESFDKSLGINLFISVIVMLCVLQFNQGLLRTYIWVHLASVFALLSPERSQAHFQQPSLCNKELLFEQPKV